MSRSIWKKLRFTQGRFVLRTVLHVIDACERVMMQPQGRFCEGHWCFVWRVPRVLIAALGATIKEEWLSLSSPLMHGIHCSPNGQA